MTEFVKETITTQNSGANQVVATPVGNTIAATPVRTTVTSSQTVAYLIYFLFGMLEILLAFRLVLKIAGASVSSAFVGLIYSLTGVFILPFEGIFRRGFTQGIETTSVLEPSTLVAIVVYPVLAWGIVKLVQILSGEQQQTN